VLSRTDMSELLLCLFLDVEGVRADLVEPWRVDSCVRVLAGEVIGDSTMGSSVVEDKPSSCSDSLDDADLEEYVNGGRERWRLSLRNCSDSSPSFIYWKTAAEGAVSGDIERG
jgi:hypothetical protein